MKRFAILLFYVMSFCSRSAGQTEFFVTVDPAGGTFRKVSILQSVNWINPGFNAYSQALHRYYFCGSKDLEEWRFFTVDATNGKVISSTTFPDKEKADIFGYTGVVYNDNDNRIYGLDYDASNKNISLVSFDPRDLTSKKKVCDLPGVTSRGMYAAIDDKNNRYLCSTSDSTGNTASSVIDLAAGIVLSSNSMPISIDHMRFDDETGLLYGLASKIGGAPMSLVSIDPITCSYSVIKSMTEMKGCYGGGGYFTYDKLHKRYFYLAVDGADEPALVTINTEDGVVPNAPQYFPYANNLGQNVICWQYDHSLDKFFALHWEPKVPGLHVRVNPNPFSYSTTIYLDTVYSSASSILFTVDGKKVQVDEVSNAKEINIKRNDLASGEYYLKVYGDGKFLEAKKVVVE